VKCKSQLQVRLPAKAQLIAHQLRSADKFKVSSVDLQSDGDLPVQYLYQTDVETVACSTTTAGYLTHWRLQAPGLLHSQTVHKHNHTSINIPQWPVNVDSIQDPQLLHRKCVILLRNH